MAELDILIQYALRLGSREIYLFANAKPAAKAGNELKPLGENLLQNQDVLRVAAELMSDDQRNALNSSGRTEFDYDVPGLGLVKCKIRSVDGVLKSVYLIPNEDEQFPQLNTGVFNMPPGQRPVSQPDQQSGLPSPGSSPGMPAAPPGSNPAMTPPPTGGFDMGFPAPPPLGGFGQTPAPPKLTPPPPPPFPQGSGIAPPPAYSAPPIPPPPPRFAPTPMPMPNVHPTPAPSPPAFQAPQPPERQFSTEYVSLGGEVDLQSQEHGSGNGAGLNNGAIGQLLQGLTTAIQAMAPKTEKDDAVFGIGEVLPLDDQGSTAEMDKLFKYMLERKGSDLHMTCGEKPIIRIHGDMVRVDQFRTLDMQLMTRLLYPLCPPKNRLQFNKNHDTDFAYEVKGLGRFRANYFVDRGGMGAVFRHIPLEVVTVEQLNLSQAIRDLCFLSKGLVLVTGPTGSGKSTTLCALIDFINRKRNDHIITIEDPIEFVHPNKNCLINQREVGVHTRGFKAALKAALREDPDVVLVGEMRDLETIAIAIETAETGHLVFGTLHTTTAASTVDRIIDQFPADRQEQIRQMLANSLKGVISQTLVKTIDKKRKAAMEVMIVTSAISNLIREGKTFQIPSIMQSSRKIGMVPLNDALIELITGKHVEVREAYMKAVDKVGFLDGLKQRNIPFNPAEMGEGPG